MNGQAGGASSPAARDAGPGAARREMLRVARPGAEIVVLDRRRDFALEPGAWRRALNRPEHEVMTKAMNH